MQSVMRFVICIMLLVMASGISAQNLSEDYFNVYAESDEYSPEIFTDSALFYGAVLTPEDLFGQIMTFRTSMVGYRRQGVDWDMDHTIISGARVDYSHSATMRAMRMSEHRSGVGSVIAGSYSQRYTQFSLADQEHIDWRRVSVRASGRDYMVGARMSGGAEIGRNWFYSASLDARSGRDLLTQGVFTNSLLAGARLTKYYGNDEHLSLVLSAPYTHKGLRSITTLEAMDLTDDRLYNPAWGFDDGQVRNSRQSRELLPLIVADWVKKVNHKTTLNATVSTQMGYDKYGTLGWFSAPTPDPDNYRYMPSYLEDDMVTQAWIDQDARYTQVDWDELRARNRMAGGHALYVVEDRVTSLLNSRARIASTTKLSDELSLNFGVSASYDQERQFKVLSDLLDAEYLIDLDHFLIDDDSYGNMLQNDLRNPNRVIREGDRYGYDYTLQRMEYGTDASLEYRADRLGLDLDLSLSDVSVKRVGHYEKELFAGDGSYGESKSVKLSPYALCLGAGWAFSPRESLRADLNFVGTTPQSEEYFLQPDYNNRIAQDPTLEQTISAALKYVNNGSMLSYTVLAYARLVSDQRQSAQYYDDISAQYCDMVATDISTRALGVELAVKLRLSYNLSLDGALSLGDYAYVSDPRVWIYSDAANVAVDSGSPAHMEGVKMGNTPQTVASVGLDYYKSGWGLNASASYMAGRYVNPDLLRRTSRVVDQATTSPEAVEAFTHQESLGDVVSVDISTFRTLFYDDMSLTIYLAVRNLLNVTDALYSGYESSRIRSVSHGGGYLYEPHSSLYRSVYPRSLYLSVSLNF